jgi:hypothetical protein
MKPLYPSNISSSSVYLPETAPITGLMTIREPLAIRLAKPKTTKEMLDSLDSILSKREQTKAAMDEITQDRPTITNHEANPFTEDGYIRNIRSKEHTALLDSQLISEQQNTIFILGAVSTITLVTLIGSLYLRK